MILRAVTQHVVEVAVVIRHPHWQVHQEKVLEAENFTTSGLPGMRGEGADVCTLRAEFFRIARNRADK